MTNAALEKIIVELTTRTLALRTICTMLLGTYARSTSDPDAALREIFSGLDTQLDSVDVSDNERLIAAERMRAEYDWIDHATRVVLGIP